MQISLRTCSESETIALGAALARTLRPGDVLALHADLGAGKTRLVRGIAAGLGADPALVSSPTYVIMQEYGCGPLAPVRTLVHIDAYRLRGADELDTIGWDRIRHELDRGAGVVAVVEWAERLAAALPIGERRLDIFIEHGAGDSRRFVFTGADSWASRPGWEAVRQLGVPQRPPTTCPITGKPVSPDSPTYPFFDEHARMADLGRWMSGSYRVSREPGPEDLPDSGS